MKRIPLVPKMTKPRAGQFQKGHVRMGGRKLGTPNRTTTILREAILMAAATVGSNGKGKDGLVGYLINIAERYPRDFCVLLQKVLPLEISTSEKAPVLEYTMEEAVARLKDKGIEIVATFDPALPLEELPSDDPAMDEPPPTDAIN